MTEISLAVVATVHNRRALTERMIRSLLASQPDGVRIGFYITDDGSIDGSAEAITALAPSATIVRGEGSLFWAGGMRAALQAARLDAPDIFLLVNDDVEFDSVALDKLVDCYRSDPRAPIVVGSVRNQAGRTSYGGFRRSSGLGVRLQRVEPEADTAVALDTFNANCVLIDHAAMDRLNGLDPAFRHALADLDLGFRARSAGIPILLLPGHVGRCDLNTQSILDSAAHLDWRSFVRRVISPKGLPPREWMLYNRRHAGLFWFVPFLGAYAKLTARFAVKSIRKSS